MDDWRLPIVELVAIKSAIYRIDQGRLWTYALPRVKATEDELRACESRLGRPLDPQYRSFLGFANGWPAFIQPDDLLGTQELGVDRHWQLGMDVLATYRDDELRQRGLPPGSLLMPIAVSLYHSAGFFM